MGTQQGGGVKIEGVVHRPGRVMRGNIQGFKVVEIVFHFRAFGHVVTSTGKMGLNTLQRTGYRVQAAFLQAAALAG